MGVQVLHVPIQDQQIAKKTMIFTLTNISNNIIETLLLLCYFLYQGVYALHLLHTASLVQRFNRKSFPWAYKYYIHPEHTTLYGASQSFYIPKTW